MPVEMCEEVVNLATEKTWPETDLLENPGNLIPIMPKLSNFRFPQ
jgi:hypothetical protein